MSGDAVTTLLERLHETVLAEARAARWPRVFVKDLWPSCVAGERAWLTALASATGIELVALLRALAERERDHSLIRGGRAAARFFLAGGTVGKDRSETHPGTAGRNRVSMSTTSRDEG
jgi:hypothetical protein